MKSTLQTKRLWFRPYTMDDLQNFAALASDADVMRYIGSGVTWSRQESVERLQRFIRQYETAVGLGLMAVLRQDDGMFLGHAGLIPQMVEGKEELEIGYWLAKAYWGMGYATEAARAWRDFALQELGKKRVISIIQLENKASIHVVEKIGMSFERVARFRDKQVAVYALEQLSSLH